MKNLDAGILAGLQAETVRVIYLVRLEFDGGTVAWNSGFRDMDVDGITYYGAGVLSTISAASEEIGMKSASFSVGLSGIDPSVVSLLLSEPYINRAAYVYYTLLDENDEVIAGAPPLLFRGSIDSINGEIGESASFSISLRSRLADWERPRKCLFTDAEQQKLYPGDKSFEFVGQISQAKIIWPRAKFLPDPRD